LIGGGVIISSAKESRAERSSVAPTPAFLARCEARAAEKMKERLGHDIFERAEERMAAWRAGRTPIVTAAAVAK